MEEANRVCSLLCLSLLLTTLSESCSDVNTERLISGSRYRVQEQFFIADSVDEKYTPQQARLEGDSWCSSDSLTTSSEPPWLQVTFDMEFNISLIKTGGYDGYLKNYYVTRFEVHIGNGTSGSLHPLTVSDNSMQPVVFRRTGTYDVEDTVLPSPVIARVLRIVTVGWSPRNQVCLRLEALGCPPNPAPPTVPTTATEVNTESSSYSTQETQPTEEISEAISHTSEKTLPTEAESLSYTTQELILASPHGRSNIVVVAGAVAGGLGLMVTLLLLIIVVTAIYILTRRRSAQVQLPESCEVYSEHMFDNSSYKEIPLHPLCMDIPEHDVDNSIYGNKKLIKTENHLDIRDVPSSIMSNIYESIPASTTMLHEPRQDFNGTLDPQNEGLHGNPLYEKTSIEVFKMEYHLARPCIPSSITSNTYESIPATSAILNEPVPDHMKTIDPQDEEMHDNPLYDQSTDEDFKMEYHLSQPSISSSNTYELLHEPVQDLSGTLNPQDEGMLDNSLYKSNENDFKMENRLSQPSISSLNIYEPAILHEPVDLNGTLDLQDQGMHDNPLYDKISEDNFKTEYLLTRPSVPSIIAPGISEFTPTTTVILHEAIQDVNETVDSHDQQMSDNPLYGKINA